MDNIEEEREEMASSAEERESLEEETEEDDVEDDSGTDEDEGDDVQESRHDEDNDKEEELLPQASEKKGENKQCEGLNVNNEVVRMRKEVKRVRVLIIRKLTRQIGTLRKKKGNETEIERNQRRISRLLEEIHAMKFLSPDSVTKTALQKNLNFEQVCKNPKSTISDRAIARIATHPQFNQKIEGIKAAVKSFKDERTKSGKQVGKEKVQNNAEKGNPQPLDKKKEKRNEKKDNVILEAKKKMQNQEGGDIFKETAGFTESEKERGNASKLSVTSVCQGKETSQHNNVKPAITESSNEMLKNTPQINSATKKSAPEAPLSKKEEDESDLELSDDEDKQYFDDSTEERFHKQSSESGESESEDDFFIGKVSKYGKKKRNGTEREKGHEVKGDPAVEVQSKQDELESKPKLNSFQSIFCSSLTRSKPGAGRGAGRGRGGDKFRSQGKPKGGSGVQRDFGKQSKFQKQEKGTGKHSLNPKTDWSKKPFSSDSRGKGRGRGNAISQKPQRGGGLFSQQKPQQALHPSWEASKKRKEQQGQILAFQGKKIKFDDDD